MAHNGTSRNNSYSGCDAGDIPYSHELFEHTNAAEKFFMFLCTALMLFLIIDFLFGVASVVRNYKTGFGIKFRTCQLIGIYPAVAIAALFALFFPRADLLCDLLATVYMSRAVFQFVSLMTLYFGGKKKLLRCIKDDKIALRSPPCCCCFCLPKIDATERSFIVFKILALQSAIVLPVLSLTSVVLWLDGKYKNGLLSATDAFPYMNALIVVSTILSLYAYIILYRLCRKYLASLSISVKFLSLQLVISITKIQALIMSILASNGIPACRGELSSVILSQTYKQIIVILEMFLLSLLARRVYRDTHDETAILVAIETSANLEDQKPDEVRGVVVNGNHELQSPIKIQPSSKQDTKDESLEPIL